MAENEQDIVRAYESDPRLSLALQATWEIEQLMTAVVELQATGPKGPLIRGLAIRARELNSAIMSALSDAMVTPDEIFKTVTGEIAMARMEAAGHEQ